MSERPRVGMLVSEAVKEPHSTSRRATLSDGATLSGSKRSGWIRHERGSECRRSGRSGKLATFALSPRRASVCLSGPGVQAGQTRLGGRTISKSAP
jgi:hypothetical protein